MKSFIFAISFALILSACGSGGLPRWKSAKSSAAVASDTVAVPKQADMLAQNADAAAVKLKLKKNQSANNIIAYFSKNGQPADSAQAGGFYRQLLGHNAAGAAVVQDFYQDSQSKQTNPFVITDSDKLNSFDSSVGEGRVIWYKPTGEMTEFLDYQNGLVQRGGYYNNAGTLVLETEGDNSRDPDALVKVRGFYDNGQVLFESLQQNDASESTFYYENGQKMWHGVSGSETIHAWSKDGKPIDLGAISDEVSEAEKRAGELMRRMLIAN